MSDNLLLRITERDNPELFQLLVRMYRTNWNLIGNGVFSSFCTSEFAMIPLVVIADNAPGTNLHHLETLLRSCNKYCILLLPSPRGSIRVLCKSEHAVSTSAQIIHEWRSTCESLFVRYIDNGRLSIGVPQGTMTGSAGSYLKVMADSNGDPTWITPNNTTFVKPENQDDSLKSSLFNVNIIKLKQE